MWKQFGLLLVLLIAVLGCEQGWKEFKGYCYRGFRNDSARVDKDEADRKCMDFGGFLTDIPDEETCTFLEGYYVGNQPTDPVDYPLIGIMRSGIGEKWGHPMFLGVDQFVNPPADGSSMCLTIRFETGGSLKTFPADCYGKYTSYVCKKKLVTTTTKKPTTTTPPKITDPKKWIIDDKLGTQLHRSFHSGWQSHHYTIDWRTTPANFQREGGPGYVVSEDRFPQIKATCPGLKKVGIWRSGTISYIGNNPPAGFQRKESFYCANRQFECGANHLLRQLNKQGGGDIFYPSDENEAYMQLLGYKPEYYKTLWFPETPCWVWKDREDTWYSIAKADGGMIWGGYHDGALVHYYTLQRHLVPAGFDPKAGPGYVVQQNVYDSYFKYQCPELVAARIWHGNNNKNEHITWIGREGRQPPAAVQNTWQEGNRFYCAPRANYCNANYLLRRMDKTNNGPISFFYPGDENEAWAQLGGAAPGVWKNSKWSEEVCYIWQRW